MPLKISLRKNDGTSIEKDVIFQNNQFGVMLPANGQEYFCKLDLNKEMKAGTETYKIDQVIKEDGTRVKLSGLKPPQDSHEIVWANDRLYLLKNSYEKGFKREPEAIWRADNAGSMQPMQKDTPDYKNAEGHIFWGLTQQYNTELINWLDNGRGTDPNLISNAYSAYYNMNEIAPMGRDGRREDFNFKTSNVIMTSGFMANSNDPGVQQFNAYLADILNKNRTRPLRLLVPLGVKGDINHMNGLVVDIDEHSKVNILVYDSKGKDSGYTNAVQTEFLNNIRWPNGYTSGTITKNQNMHQTDMECGHHTLNFLEFAHKQALTERNHKKLLERYNDSLNDPNSLVQNNGSAARAKAKHRERLVAFGTEIESYKNGFENELNPGSRDLHARQAESRDRAAASQQQRADTPSQARPTSDANLLAPTAIQRIEAIANAKNWKVEKAKDKITIDNIGGNKDNKVIVEKNIIRMSANEESYKAGAEIAKELINDSKGVGKKEILGLKLSNASNNVEELAKMANANLAQGVAVYIEPPRLLAEVKAKVTPELQDKLQSGHEKLSEKLSAKPSDPMRKAAAQRTTPDGGGEDPNPDLGRKSGP